MIKTRQNVAFPSASLLRCKRFYSFATSHLHFALILTGCVFPGDLVPSESNAKRTFFIGTKCCQNKFLTSTLTFS